MCVCVCAYDRTLKTESVRRMKKRTNGSAVCGRDNNNNNSSSYRKSNSSSSIHDGCSGSLSSDVHAGRRLTEQ